MATMTIAEAEHIIGVFSTALQEESRAHYHPISSLQGYDVFQIDLALKLRIANWLLYLAGKDDWEKRFAEVVRECETGPLYADILFVPDDDLAKLERLDPCSLEYKALKIEIMPSPLIINPSDDSVNYKDQRFAQLETGSSFADFCRSVGAEDPLYWQKIYTRLDLEYTSTAPKGNDPVFVNESSDVVTRPATSGALSDAIKPLIGGVLWLLVLCWISYPEVGDSLLELAIIRRAQVATGVRVVTWKAEEEGKSDEAGYAFRVPDGREFTIGTDYAFEDLDKQCEIEYLPDNPDVSRIKGDGCQGELEWLFRNVGSKILFFALIAAPGVIMLRIGVRDLWSLRTRSQQP